MSEWYCDQCRKWNAYSCCTGCLRINPSDVRWMTESEIRYARERALQSGR